MKLYLRLDIDIQEVETNEYQSIIRGTAIARGSSIVGMIKNEGNAAVYDFKAEVSNNNKSVMKPRFWIEARATGTVNKEDLIIEDTVKALAEQIIKEQQNAQLCGIPEDKNKSLSSKSD